MARKTGRQFFANPGPTNIPDSILRSMDRPTIDFMDGEFGAVFAESVGGLKRVLRTAGDVFLYTASGHGSWEATIVNLFSPGDTVLIVETGWFSEGWSAMATKFGLHPVVVAGPDWRRGVEYSAITAALKANPAARGVLTVHNETSTGMALDLPSVRAAIDAAGSEALLLVDTISSLGSLEFRFDEWGIDAAVGGSQKGLMLPTGFSFTAVSAARDGGACEAGLPRHYFDWTEMQKRSFRAFMGTVPTGMFYGLAESVRLIEAEGLDAVIARHHRLAEGGAPCGADLGRQFGRAGVVLPAAGAAVRLGDRHADSPTGSTRTRSARRRWSGSTCRPAEAWASWAANCCASAIWGI